MRYLVLFPGDENAWEAATPQERAATYARHDEFGEQLRARGHSVVGGAELTHSREATVLRFENGAHTVTEGPYAETVEQLTGYYDVETEDFADLVEVCAIVAGPDHQRTGMRAIEIRRVGTEADQVDQPEAALPGAAQP